MFLSSNFKIIILIAQNWVLHATKKPVSHFRGIRSETIAKREKEFVSKCRNQKEKSSFRAWTKNIMKNKCKVDTISSFRSLFRCLYILLNAFAIMCRTWTCEARALFVSMPFIPLHFRRITNNNVQHKAKRMTYPVQRKIHVHQPNRTRVCTRVLRVYIYIYHSVYRDVDLRLNGNIKLISTKKKGTSNLLLFEHRAHSTVHCT